MHKDHAILIPIKKALGNQKYLVNDVDYREKLLNNPIINGLFTVGKSFVILANTFDWSIVAVTGDSLEISGYTNKEIQNMGGEFVMNFTVQEHLQVNMATLKTCMEYSNSIPAEQREHVFAVYFYHGIKKNNEIIAIQHQSIPLAFDENNVPYLFCNIYSDISYLDPQNIPHGMMVNKYTNDVLHLNKNSFELEIRKEIFSNREKEIIRLMTDGDTSNEIASKLNISSDTVRTHRKNILGKAGVNNTISLIKYSIVNSIL